MKFASSLYRGGELVDASVASYQDNRELGLVCPFCKESVFLAREHTRKETLVRASWRHYKMSQRSAFCEERALSVKGKEQLKQLQSEARGQRLKLFNRRFWEIFKQKKHIPPIPPMTLKEACLLFTDKQTLKKIIIHCKEKWDVPAILQAIPHKIQSTLGSPELANAIRNQIGFVGEDRVQEALDYYTNIEFSILRYKILSEVIEWLGTETASSSFEKVIELAFLDCVEIYPMPVHTEQIAHMAIVSLILTDWEVAINSLKSPTKGIGFSR
jgi:hypothetical protein